MELNSGTKLRLARQALGISQKDFAKIAGVSLSTLKRYEKGEREPSMTVIANLSSALNINPLYLLPSVPILTEIDNGCYMDEEGNMFEMDKEGVLQEKNIECEPKILVTEQTPKEKISQIINTLNMEGQEKVCQYAEDLSHIDKYRNRTGDSKEVNSPESDSDE